MKPSGILIVGCLLSGGVYCVYNLFFSASMEPVHHTMDEKTRENRYPHNETPKMPSTSTNSIKPYINNKSRQVLSIPVQSKEFENIDSEIDSIKSQLKKLSMSVSRLSSRIARVENLDNDFSDNSESWENVSAQAAEETDERVNTMEHNLQEEPIDTDWSVEASDAIEQAIYSNDLAKHISLVGIDCRSTLCRLEVEPDNTESLAQLEDTFPQMAGDLFSQFFIDPLNEANQSNTSIVYITRNNQYIPEDNGF